MLTVRTIVDYKIVKDSSVPTPKPQGKTTREQRKLDGLCVPCGRRKPCERCNRLAQERRERSRTK